MKRIIVTPAGRKKYLELLSAHLESQKAFFNEWHLWLNTNNQDDIDYCNFLRDKNIAKIINLPEKGDRNINTIYKFFSYCIEPDTLYLRLDDDIVWLEPFFINKMFLERERDKNTLLIGGNVINNAICSHIQYRLGNLDYCGYSCLDDKGWRDPLYAAQVHRKFIEAIGKNEIDKWRFKSWICTGERFSINCISWIGEHFAKFNGAVGINEEEWLTEAASLRFGGSRMNGDAICSHFAFETQRSYLDKTNLLYHYSMLKPL